MIERGSGKGSSRWSRGRDAAGEVGEEEDVGRSCESRRNSPQRRDEVAEYVDGCPVNLNWKIGGTWARKLRDECRINRSAKGAGKETRREGQLHEEESGDLVRW